MILVDSSCEHKTSCNFSPGLKPITLIFFFLFIELVISKIFTEGILGIIISPPCEFIKEFSIVGLLI